MRVCCYKYSTDSNYEFLEYAYCFPFPPSLVYKIFVKPYTDHETVAVIDITLDNKKICTQLLEKNFLTEKDLAEILCLCVYLNKQGKINKNHFSLSLEVSDSKKTLTVFFENSEVCIKSDSDNPYSLCNVDVFLKLLDDIFVIEKLEPALKETPYIDTQTEFSNQIITDSEIPLSNKSLQNPNHANQQTSRQGDPKKLKTQQVEKIPLSSEAQKNIYYIIAGKKVEKTLEIAFIWNNDLVSFKIRHSTKTDDLEADILKITNYLYDLNSIDFFEVKKIGQNELNREGNQYIEFKIRDSWINANLVNNLIRIPSVIVNFKTENGKPTADEIQAQFGNKIKVAIAQQRYNSDQQKLTNSVDVSEADSSDHLNYSYVLPLASIIISGLTCILANQNMLTSPIFVAALAGVKFTAFGLAIAFPYLGIALAGFTLATWAIIYCKRNNIGLEDIANSFVGAIKKCVGCFGHGVSQNIDLSGKTSRLNNNSLVGRNQHINETFFDQHYKCLQHSKSLASLNYILAFVTNRIISLLRKSISCGRVRN